MRRTFEEADKKLLAKLWPNHCLRDIAELMDRDANTIRKHAIALGLGTKSRHYRKSMGKYREINCDELSSDVLDLRENKSSWKEISHQLQISQDMARKLWIKATGYTVKKRKPITPEQKHARSMRVHNLRQWEFSWDDIAKEMGISSTTARRIWTSHECPA